MIIAASNFGVGPTFTAGMAGQMFDALTGSQRLVAGGVGSAISWTEVGALHFSFLTLVAIELMAFAALLQKAPRSHR
jgi:hypothetical protein